MSNYRVAAQHRIPMRICGEAPAKSLATDVTPNDASQVYVATLQLETSVNGGTLSPGATQAPLASGTVTYSGSGGPNGSLTFTLNEAPANLTFSPVEGTIEEGGSDNYQMYSSSGRSAFTTNSSGGLTFTVLQDGAFGDIFSVDPASGYDQGYMGGFWIP